ncbi:hypothetical protein ACHWQZ_G005962 [Mnemiopsis leidyi]
MVTSSEKSDMLGSATTRPENISLAAPKERIDYTLVEEEFSKLAVDDEFERKQVIQEISSHILEMAKSELHSVKLFLSTILRLAHRAPFTEVSEGMKTLLGDLESLGLQVPRVRFRKGPSFYIPKDKVPKLDDTKSEVWPIFRDAFMNDARVSHMVQVMGLHPKYLVHWVQAHHHLMRECNGVLPRHFRAYIAIIASARHNCLYTVNLLEREFLCFGGDQEWLEGLKNAPKKLQNLATVNNILCHKPWAITSQHMQDLLTGPDSWSRPELTQALTIICHFHALTTFVLGCGLTHEIDSIAGHNYGSSGYCTPVQSYPNSPQVDSGEDDLLGDPENNGNPIMFDDIYTRLLQEDGSPRLIQDVNHQIFTDLIEQQATSSGGSRRKTSALAHYMMDPEMEYEKYGTQNKTKVHRIFGEELDWEEMGYPCCRNLDVVLADILNRKFENIQELTYHTMGGKENIDTSKLRSSVWYYVHRLWGIYYYNVDYSMIQELLPPGFRNYIFCTTCMPEQLKEDIFNNWESKRGFTHSEKVHFCLIIMEARFQAEYCFALKALSTY